MGPERPFGGESAHGDVVLVALGAGEELGRID